MFILQGSGAVERHGGGKECERRGCWSDFEAVDVRLVE